MGVFVREAPETVAALLESGVIHMAQLHGGEDGAYLRRLRALTRGPVIQALRISSARDLEAAEHSAADYLLLDSGAGTGKVFDWGLIRALDRPYFLAGGLGPDNVGRPSPNCTPSPWTSARASRRREKGPGKNGGLRGRGQEGRETMTNPNGRFGIHGGQYIPETLMNAVIELEAAYQHYRNDPGFNQELSELLNEYAGRPSRLYYAEKMSRDLGGAKIYLKREDLNHTGAHKINNVLGQALLAKRWARPV